MLVKALFWSWDVRKTTDTRSHTLVCGPYVFRTQPALALLGRLRIRPRASEDAEICLRRFLPPWAQALRRGASSHLRTPETLGLDPDLRHLSRGRGKACRGLTSAWFDKAPGDSVEERSRGVATWHQSRCDRARQGGDAEGVWLRTRSPGSGSCRLPFPPIAHQACDPFWPKYFVSFGRHLPFLQVLPPQTLLRGPSVPGTLALPHTAAVPVSLTQLWLFLPVE